ncbi:hypothetical protein BB560_000529 [Smittium megazygosporum]|uniref:Mediator of RNA polymerase II transcription subunit 9 n=1 Tax=Smittium megazygosporum TaxID=133381 RepID=A0A2T9ZK24_9FUNG|nr:hypothetical protein BB560_000529 [Smittium megazygosporum]
MTEKENDSNSTEIEPVDVAKEIEYALEWNHTSMVDDLSDLLSLIQSPNDERNKTTALMTQITEKMKGLQSHLSSLPGIHLSLEEQREIFEQETLRAKEKL